MPDNSAIGHIATDIGAWVSEQLAPTPLKLIAKTFRMKVETAEQAVQPLVVARRLFAWPDQGARKQRLWHIAPEVFVRDLLVAASRDKALAKAALLRAATGKVAHGLERDFAEGCLAGLLAEGRIQRYEKTKAVAELYGAAGEPRAWFAAAPDSLRALLEQVTGDSGQDLAARIVAAAHRLEPQPAQLLSVRRLRLAPELADVSKRDLDSSLVALWRAGKVWLSQHHDAAGLTEDDRFLMAQDEEGNDYVAVTILAG